MILSRSEILERFFEPRWLQRLVGERPLLTDLEWAVYNEDGKCCGHIPRANTAPELPETLAGHELLPHAMDCIATGTARPLTLSNGAIYVAPIVVEAGGVGFVSARNGRSDASADLASVVELFAEACAAHLSGKQTSSDLGAELSSRYEELALVYQMTEFLDVKQQPSKSVAGILAAVANTLDVDCVALSVPELGMHWTHPAPTAESIALTSWLLGQLQRRKNTLALHSTDRPGEHTPEIAPLAHVIAVPLEVDGCPGVFAIGRLDAQSRFFMGDVKLVQSISRQVEILLANVKFTAARRQLFDLTIFGLARLAESRDPETGAHLERVGSYCEIIASALNRRGVAPGLIDEEFVQTIGLSSALHDIGKVGVPDSVLQKPGKLTDEEFEIMKTHARIGGDTLQDIERHLNWGESTFLSMGREIAYYHHEKWDGSGYPFSIKGEDIPLPARIMALADVYDALTSKRCYKAAFEHDRAAGIIRESVGQHFDPMIVEMFDASEEEFVHAREKIECGEWRGPIARTDRV